jgi:hypothetical protein
MKLQQVNIFSDIEAKRKAEESKRKYSARQSNGSFSPTGVKFESTRKHLERELEMMEAGTYPHSRGKIKNIIHQELIASGKTPAKAAIIGMNASRRTINAYCYTRQIPVTDEWRVREVYDEYDMMTTKEICQNLRDAINLPSELCSDTVS